MKHFIGEREEKRQEEKTRRKAKKKNRRDLLLPSPFLSLSFPLFSSSSLLLFSVRPHTPLHYITHSFHSIFTHIFTRELQGRENHTIFTYILYRKLYTVGRYVTHIYSLPHTYLLLCRTPKKERRKKKKKKTGKTKRNPRVRSDPLYPLQSTLLRQGESRIWNSLPPEVIHPS